jgi:CheY-like chemotaxis protein
MDDAVLRVVTSNNVDVFRLLGQSPIGRLRVDYTVAADQTELLGAVHRLRPQVVLIDTELAGGNGYSASRAIKDSHDALGHVHVVILLSNPPGDRAPGAPPHKSRLSRADIDRLYDSGADDVLALPIHPDDFYHHLAHLAGLPFRRDRRVRIDLEMSWPGPEGTIVAQVTNAGAGGIGILCERAVPAGTTMVTRLRQGEVVTPDTRATVAWCRQTSEGFTAGLRWEGDPPIKTRVLLEQVALFDLEPMGEGIEGVAVTLHGDFTELTRFDALATRLAGESFVEFDTASVRYMSSAGVRAWCQFIDALPSALKYRFRHCSVAFASQAAMVPMVLGRGEVISLEAPYVCETCDEEDLRLLEISAIAREGDRPIPPRLTCLHCNGEISFDDVPERYFAFLMGA